jgi:hypothetical protein
MNEKKSSNSFEAEMNRQIKERITEMEQLDYEVGKPFNKKDWLLAGLVVTTGVILIIAGLF